MEQRVFRFGPFSLTSQNLELHRDGERIELQVTPARLLAYLLAHPGRVISKEELFDHVWSDAVVTDAAIATALRAVRRAIAGGGLDDAIETHRGRGYVFAASVTEEAIAWASGQENEAAGRGLFGRDAELDRITHAIRVADPAGGSLTLVRGPAGIGKSALMRALLERMRGEGFEAAWGWCDLDSGHPPYWPWIQVLRELGEGDAFSARSAASSGGDGSDRFLFFDQVSARLGRVGAASGLVVVIDDAQWADASTLKLLTHVSRELGHVRLHLVCALREPSASGAEAAQALDACATLPWAQSITLAGLDEASSAALLQDEEIPAPSSSDLSKLVASMRGNPLHLKGWARMIRTAGQGAAVVDDFTGLSELVRGQIARLDEDTTALLEAAAIVGPVVMTALAAEIAGLGESAAQAAMREAEGAALLQVSDDQTMRFSHSLYRETIYGGLPEARRIDLHQRAARALESGLESIGRGISEVAHHYSVAARGADASKAHLYSIQAGREAMRLHAYEEAVVLFQNALSWLTPTASSERADALCRMAEARIRSGEAALGRPGYFEASGIARQLGDAPLLARAALGYAGTGALVGNVDRSVVRLLEEAHEALDEPTHPLAIRLRARLGAELLNSMRRDEAQEVVELALAEARASGVDALEVAALTAKIWIDFGQPSPDLALESATRALEVADASGNWPHSTLARNYRIRALLECGDLDAVEKEIDAFEDWVDRHGVASRRHQIAARRSMLALLSGDLDTAQAQLDLSRELGQRYEDEATLQVGGIVQLGIMRERGLSEGFIPAIEDSIEAYPQNWPWRCALANLLVLHGRREAGAKEFNRLMAHPVEDMPRDANWVPSLTLLAETCESLGDADAAERLVPLLEPHAGKLIVFGSSAVCMGSARRPLGLLQIVLGREPSAIESLEAAIDTNDRIGSRLYSAHARGDLARLLLSTGGDGERARSLAEAAWSIGEETGSALLRERTRVTLEKLGAAD